MTKVFILNFRKYGDWFLGDLYCKKYNIDIKDYIFTKKNMPKFWYTLDDATPGEEMFMYVDSDELLKLK